MSPADDVEFLALLVYRGWVERERAQVLVAGLREGAKLDQLLENEPGWTADKVARARRTRAGEIPEIPGYEILGPLGKGGTADVFRARDKKTRQILALKVLRPEAHKKKGLLASFVGEARLLGKLRHTGLVQGHGVARYGDTYFSRLECIEGRTLLELLDGGRTFAEQEALQIVLAAAEAMQYLESQGVVHRDLKPGNIMLDARGRVILIDLGFAAAQGSVTSDSDSAVGTPAYLSPEQALGGAAADSRSDIYSLGVTLFHLVVGRLPFQDSDDRELLRMQVMQSLSSPELKARHFSPHLHYFIEKMMAKDAEHRYQSWSELMTDVRNQIEGYKALDFEREPRGPRRR